MNKKVVVIGGGTGLSTILTGIKSIPQIDIAAIVSVADDGGSTGKITRDFKMPAVGDIRRVLVSLSKSGDVLDQLMNHRFVGQSDVTGHALGNLMIAGMYNITQNFYQAIEEVSHILQVQGKIYPISDEVMTLYAKMADDVIVQGESHIPKYKNYIKHVFYQEDYHVNPEAIQAILEADLVILGIGSLYTSILPVIILDEVKQALQQTSAKVIYMCNGMTQPGETDGYNVKTHVQAIYEHAGMILDQVVVSNSLFHEDVLAAYLEQGSQQVIFNPSDDYGVPIIQADLMSGYEGFIRHNPIKVALCIESIIKED